MVTCDKCHPKALSLHSLFPSQIQAAPPVFVQGSSAIQWLQPRAPQPHLGGKSAVFPLIHGRN